MDETKATKKDKRTKYDEANTIRFTIKFNKHTEKEMFDYIEDCVSSGKTKQGAVKTAMRYYLKHKDK